jgi:hypothetical protein
MAKLKVPSLQHLARNWKPESGMISRDLVNLVRNPPTFSYNAVFSATYDLLHFKQPLEQVMRGLEKAEKRARVRQNFLEILPLIHKHFEDTNPNFVNKVSTRRYVIGQGLDIPFTPPLIYGVGGQIYFPWFSFWKSNSMANLNLRLFVTIVDEILRSDPDLDQSIFEILDFSCLQGEGNRSLKVIDTREIEHVSQAEKIEMLEIFADGYTKAKAILEAEPVKAPRKPADEEDRYSDDLQPDFFL